MHRGVYFDAWFPRQHCYHPSLPPRRLRMVDDLVDYRATVLVWASMGGGSLSLPYLEQEAFGPVDALHRAGYQGVVSVEHEDTDWSGDPDRVRRGLAIAERTLAPLVHV